MDQQDIFLVNVKFIKKQKYQSFEIDIAKVYLKYYDDLHLDRFFIINFIHENFR